MFIPGDICSWGHLNASAAVPAIGLIALGISVRYSEFAHDNNGGSGEGCDGVRIGYDNASHDGAVRHPALAAASVVVSVASATVTAARG